MTMSLSQQKIKINLVNKTRLHIYKIIIKICLMLVYNAIIFASKKGVRGMPFYFQRGDLVAAQCDAIVNASNVNLKMVEGVGRAIFHKAGDKELTNACKQIGHCDVGGAVMTPSFNLTNAKAIIHAVGPIYINGKHGEEKNLRKTYRSVFQIALENNFKTLAFPLLSGEFNYPLKECYEIAQDEFKNFLAEHKDFKIYMILFKNFPENVSEDEQSKLSKFILKNFDTNANKNIKNSKKSNKEFIETIRSIQNNKNISDEDLAFRSNFSPDDLNKILSEQKELPSKNICFALAVGLEATKDEFVKILNSIGVESVKDDMTGLVTAYFLEKKEFNLFKINTVLFNYDVRPLGL